MKTRTASRRRLLGWFCVVFVVATMGVGCERTSVQSVDVLFDVMEKSIPELTAALNAGEVTSRELVAAYWIQVAFDISCQSRFLLQRQA